MKSVFMIVWVLCLVALSPTIAKAGTEALISFHGTDEGSWDRRYAVTNLLRGHYGFDEVNVLTDVTSEEIPLHVRNFLEAPGRDGDKRFVWISGLQGAQGKTVCPGSSYMPVRPAVPSLILAPDCYLGSIRFPQGARHYGMTVPEPRLVSARLGRIDAGDPVWIALLTLPVGESRFITGADSLVIDKLTAEKEKGVIDPIQILHALRVGFRWNGSAYTPTLDLFHRDTEIDLLAPFGFLASNVTKSQFNLTTRAKLRVQALEVHATPVRRSEAVISILGTESVRVLRSDKTGAMSYAAIGDYLYGWVPSNDLQY